MMQTLEHACHDGMTENAMGDDHGYAHPQAEENVHPAYQPQAGADEPHSRAATPPLPQAGANEKHA